MGGRYGSDKALLDRTCVCCARPCAGDYCPDCVDCTVESEIAKARMSPSCPKQPRPRRVRRCARCPNPLGPRQHSGSICAECALDEIEAREAAGERVHSGTKAKRLATRAITVSREKAAAACVPRPRQEPAPRPKERPVPRAEVIAW